MDYSERRMRAEIAAFPDGKLRLRGRASRTTASRTSPTPIAVNMLRPGRRDHRRLSAELEQAQGPDQRHARRRTGAVYNGILHVTDPSIPKNSGCFRPITVIAPPGTVVNVDYPGPLGRRQYRDPSAHRQHCDRRACRSARPSAAWRPTAAPAPTSCSAATIPTATNTSPATISCRAAGAAASARRQRLRDRINGNCRFIPTEVFETRFPLWSRSAPGPRFRRGRPVARRPRVTRARCA